MHIFRESQISFSQKHIALVVAMFMILFLSGGVPVVRSVTMVVTMLMVAALITLALELCLTMYRLKLNLIWH